MSKKRIQRKLTDKLKEKIKKDHASLKLKDFDGDALHYLKTVKSLAKARKTKKKRKSDNQAKIDDLIIPEDSELYEVVKRGARLKKMTVKQFVKKYRKELEALMQDGDFIVQRETEYLIEDVRHVKKGKKVLVNDGNGYRVTPKLKDIFHIQQFTQHIMTHTDIFLIVYRVHYKVTGDLSHYLPDISEYEPLEEEEEIIDMLDTFYPEITYLKSGKKDAPKQEKVIEPNAPERNKKASKGKSNQRSKRKGASKTSKGK